MIWTAAPALCDTPCGRCGARFAAGAPVALITDRKLWRCQTCILEQFPGVTVDWAAVDAARARHEAQRAGTTYVTKPGRASAPILTGFLPVSAGAAQGLDHLLKHTGGIAGRKQSRPKPFSKVAHVHDPKARAFND